MNWPYKWIHNSNRAIRFQLSFLWSNHQSSSAYFFSHHVKVPSKNRRIRREMHHFRKDSFMAVNATNIKVNNKFFQGCMMRLSNNRARQVKDGAIRRRLPSNSDITDSINEKCRTKKSCPTARSEEAAKKSGKLAHVGGPQQNEWAITDGTRHERIQ